ncbi:MAG: hypothetical protein CMP66_02600 [Flavobacteriales bacterium]|nr:hypothetical protein [Flavobacteriales bacterium]|tara:strand:+ start:338 stop:748 length:411 start_codon:yes stop_codon:yes gene_type:complete
MQLNLSEKHKSYILKLTIAWFIYGFAVNVVGSCHLQMKMTKDGEYYVFYEQTESDIGDGYVSHYEYDVIIADSLTLFEAEEMINDCIQDKEQIMKKYGTVYNLKTGNSVIDILISIFILFLPVFLVFIIFKSELIK